MSLIKDVKEEISALPLDKKSLRKFGLWVGGIFIAISSFLFFNEIKELIFWIFLGVGGVLFLSGLTSPGLLRTIYIWWMSGAVVLGWLVSRLILTIIFFSVITPIGIIAKVVGKKFLDLKFIDGKNSYWNIRPSNKKIRYDKMY